MHAAFLNTEAGGTRSYHRVKDLGAVYTYPFTMRRFVVSQRHIEGVVLRFRLQPSRCKADTRTYNGCLSHVTGSVRFRSSPNLLLEEHIASEAYLDTCITMDNVYSLRFVTHKI